MLNIYFLLASNLEEDPILVVYFSTNSSKVKAAKTFIPNLKDPYSAALAFSTIFLLALKMLNLYLSSDPLVFWLWTAFHY